jgi:hypothetical protein
MKKKILYGFMPILGLFIFIGYLLMNPPLDTTSTMFFGSDNKTIIVPVGNKGFANIHNLDVVINGQSQPDDAKIQMLQTPEDAFSLSPDMGDKAIFKELGEVHLPPGTAIQKSLENDSEGIDAYGLTIRSESPIYDITISYRYLGIPYKEVYRGGSFASIQR